MRKTGFTLVELLIVIGLIALLTGMLIPVVGMILESSRKAKAASMVSALHMALRSYAAEDSAHRFPPQEPDLAIRGSGSAAAPRALDLLIPAFINAGVETLVRDAGGTLLADPWSRPYRCQVDANGDGVAQRPDPALGDWNARGQEPFAYVWSLGRPRHGDAGGPGDPDGLPGSGAPWIYVKTTVAAP